MTKKTAHRKKEASDHALATGAIPLDPYSGYLTWFLRACVEVGAASGLDWLCRVCPERELEILDAWCRRACEDGNRWAWQEARSRLEDLVARGQEVSAPLARFAIEPPPRLKPGTKPEGSRAVLIEFMARVLAEGGLDGNEVNKQFGESFPVPGRKNPGSTIRKRRSKGRPYVAPAFEACAGDDFGVQGGRRAVVLECDWSDPIKAARPLLVSGWPAFARLWEFWPEHRAEHLRLWCERARVDSWVWDEVRALFDHAIYCGWSMPSLLRGFVAIPRPANPSGRPVGHGRRIGVAAIEVRLAQEVRSVGAAQSMVFEAFVGLGRDLGLNLDHSRVHRDFVSGREQLQGVFALPV